MRREEQAPERALQQYFQDYGLKLAAKHLRISRCNRLMTVFGWMRGSSKPVIRPATASRWGAAAINFAWVTPSKPFYLPRLTEGSSISRSMPDQPSAP